MIPIKIQCSCGQRYSFDVEPVDGLMPGPVACPVCGTDGTGAANSVIQQSLTAREPATPAPAPKVRLRATAPIPPKAATAGLHSTMQRATAPRTGQIDRSQVEVEARAKIFWGDKPDEVVKYLMMNGYDAQEASALVNEMRQERAAAIRRKGVRKIMVGSGMVCVPLIAWAVMASVGILFIKLLGVAGAVGLWGLWKVFDGFVMFVSPKSERGDVADK